MTLLLNVYYNKFHHVLPMLWKINSNAIFNSPCLKPRVFKPETISKKFDYVQAALVIRGFDYPRLSNCVQNLLSANNSLSNPQIFIVFGTKRHNTALNRGPSLSAVLVFAQYEWEVTPANNEGRL